MANTLKQTINFLHSTDVHDDLINVLISNALYRRHISKFPMIRFNSLLRCDRKCAVSVMSRMINSMKKRRAFIRSCCDLNGVYLCGMLFYVRGLFLKNGEPFQRS
jgi:hypothetical protein